MENLKESEGALFFYSKNSLNKEVLPKKPIRVLFLTSIRDIVLEEFNGLYIEVDGVQRYMEGVIERTLKEEKNGILTGIIELAGIIFDDMEDDLKGKISLDTASLNSIFSIEFSLNNLIWNIPSTFRKEPKDSFESRRFLKNEFENKVMQKALDLNVQIIILDAYMARIEFLQNSELFKNKVINIHPAPSIITMPYCFRGKNEVMDAIYFARENGGVGKTGATLHFVDEGFDSGKPIAFICNTLVNSDDTEISLMYRNYQQAKLPLFINGLRHYVTKIFPYL